MNLLNATALGLAALAIPIVLLYLLRLRRREHRVSSTLLWRQAVMDREANTLWQRLRPNILLLLQLLTLALLVFALSRPYTLTPAALTGRVIVMLDASASMSSADVSPNRFEVARREARSFIDRLSSTDEMALILVDGSPRAAIAPTSSKPDLYVALDAAQPTLSAANWSAGLSLAAALSNATTTFVIISDGANSEDLRTFVGPARFIAVGRSGANVSVASVALRPTVRGVSALTTVVNHGLEEITALVSLRSVLAGGATTLLDARELKLAAGQTAQWTVNGIDARVEALQATLDRVTPAAGNNLPIDDAAFAVNAMPSPRRALLLSRGNRFLEQALGSLPNLQVTRAVSMPLEVETPYDLIVVDGITATLPTGSHALFVGPIADTPAFTLGDAFSATAFVSAADHPTLQGVDWRAVNVLDARRVYGPAWLQPIVNGQGGPLVFAGEPPPSDGSPSRFDRLAVIAFDLRRSDLPLQIAFPVLMANTVEWLAPLRGLDVPASVRPGEAVALPAGAIITDPNGARLTVEARGFAATASPGIYRYAAGRATGAFAVNFQNAAESAIAPDPTLGAAFNARPGSTPADDALSQREIWPVLAGLALIALAMEWWIYQRGLPTFRRPPATPKAR